MIIDKSIIENCYRKFKSYVYYSSNLHYLKKRIAEFENDEQAMERSFNEIANAFSLEHSSYFDQLIENVSFFVYPKTIISNDVNKNGDELNLLDNLHHEKNSTIGKVNFFIDMPIELFIVDTLWAIIISSVYLCHSIMPHAKGNVIHEDLITVDRRKSILGRIHFKSLPIYKKYFEQYVSWKNKAIEIIKDRYTFKKDSILLSLDLTNFFYSVNLDFSDFNEKMNSIDYDYSKYSFLHRIMERTYKKYSSIVKDYFSKVKAKQTIIPIGLVSSGIISNIYLDNLDKNLADNEAVEYYKRYVDDMLFVIDPKKAGISFKEEENDNDSKRVALEKILTETLGQFVKGNKKEFTVKDRNNLLVKNDKITFIFVDHKGTLALVEKLMEERVKASEYNLYPSVVDDLKSFSINIYKDPESIKIRDAGEVIVDTKKLVGLIQGYLLGKASDFDKTSPEEKELAKFKKQIGITFSNDVILSMRNRWDKLLFFSKILFGQDNVFENSILRSIRNFSSKCKLVLEGNGYLNVPDLTNRIKSSLNTSLEISKASCDAILGDSYELALKIRKANLFDFSCVSLPLLNYYTIPSNVNYYSFNHRTLFDLDLDNVSLDQFKIKYSPSFIHFSQFQYIQFLLQLDCLNKDTCLSNIREKYKTEVFSVFSEASFDEIEIKHITPEKTETKYQLVGIRIGELSNIPPKDDIFVGLANINMETHELMKGDKGSEIISFDRYGDVKFKQTLIKILKYSRRLDLDYYENDDQPAEKPKPTASGYKYLIFPEVFLEIEWLPLVEKYARKTHTTVVTGIKYMKVGDRILNLQATIIPYLSEGKYRKTLIVLREKNDYAPFEKEIIERSGYRSFDADIPLYYRFISQNNVFFTSFICYELTDIFARSLLRDRVDFLIASEFNYDIKYFSNIIESTSRELFAYVAQVNSANAGDTRLVAPYHDLKKTLISISGGVRPFTHIGKINVKSLRDYLGDYKKCNDNKDYSAIKESDFKKPSARCKMDKH